VCKRNEVKIVKDGRHSREGNYKGLALSMKVVFT
jgi:hypothetical protein